MYFNNNRTPTLPAASESGTALWTLPMLDTVT